MLAAVASVSDEHLAVAPSLAAVRPISSPPKFGTSIGEVAYCTSTQVL
jgi:hypothetical protein